MAADRSKEEKELFGRAAEEVAETGQLSFPTRRRLWLALGEWEQREEDDMEEQPRSLDGPLKKRAELALACAKKVMPVWRAYAPEDKVPQKLLKAAADYLAGKITAEKYGTALWGTGSLLDRAEEEPYSTAPAAAMAAWQAALTAWLDEPLLARRYAGATEDELDYDDWDAAYLASMAWAGRDEEAQPGEQAVQRMRFWAWYLEQLAPLLGREGYRFPPKAIRAFAEKQAPKRPVPEEVTMESLCRFLGAGDYLCHTFRGEGLLDKTPCCIVTSRMRGDHAVCPKTKEECRELEFYYSVLLYSGALPDGTMLEWEIWVPLFHCDQHPGNSHAPRAEYGNVKADLKRYLTGEGRMEALAAELRRRSCNVLVIGEGYTRLNGVTEHHHDIHIPAGVAGIRWLSQEEETLEIDLRAFGPHLFFPDCTYRELLRFYPKKVALQEDGSGLLTYKRHWVRCYTDEAGELVRVVMTSRFCLEVEKFCPDNQNRDRYNPGKRIGWVKALMAAFGVSTGEARELLEDPEQRFRERFQGLTRVEAERLQTALRSHGVKCRIMPWRLNAPGDTQLR